MNVLKTGTQHLRERLATPFLNLIFLPQCVRCGTNTSEPNSLCGTCWQDLSFLSAPHCRQCGIPFDPLDINEQPYEDLLCGACIRKPPLFQAHLSALAYDQISKDLILPFKHGDRTEFASLFAQWMGFALNALPFEPDLIIPVPLHRLRLLKRRYNQSALLGLALSKRTAIACDPCILARTRNTPSQGGLNPDKRRKNVRGAFTVSKPEKLENRHILLIDDVYTTGATLNECAHVLLSEGASSVCALTIARVLKPQSG